MNVVPSQRQSCTAHTWCTLSGDSHTSHVSVIHVLSAGRHGQVCVSLDSEAGQHADVRLDVGSGRPPTAVTLEPAEAVELAAVLLRLARTAQEARHPEVSGLH